MARRILIVDDEDGVRRVAQTTLERTARCEAAGVIARPSGSALLADPLWRALRWPS